MQLVVPNVDDSGQTLSGELLPQPAAQEMIQRHKGGVVGSVRGRPQKVEAMGEMAKNCLSASVRRNRTRIPRRGDDIDILQLDAGDRSKAAASACFGKSAVCFCRLRRSSSMIDNGPAIVHKQQYRSS